jgi:iron(III) transport system permease protein
VPAQATAGRPFFGGLQGLRINGIGWAALAIVVLLVGVPLVSVMDMSLRQGLPGRSSGLNFENYLEAYSDPILGTVVANTVLFAICTVAIALVFVVPLVWLLNRTDLPFKRVILILMISGFLVPSFLRAAGWILVFSPQVGLANQLAQSLFGLSEPPFNIYNIPGMAIVQGLSLVPSAFFMLSAAASAMDPALEEASLATGASRLRTAFRVSLPLIWPALLATVIYLLMLAVSLFEVPAIIGWPARIFVLSSLVYFAVTPNTGLPSYGLAGAYGALMVGLGLLLAAFYFRVMRNTRKYQIVTGRGYRPTLTPLGRWKYPALAFVALFLGLELLLPLVALLWVSLLPRVQAFSFEALDQISLANYAAIPSYVGWDPFINTAVLVLLAPTFAIVLSVLVSWVVVRHQSFPLRGVLDGLAFLPNALPHILFAVALAYVALLARSWVPIYGTILLIALAHGIAFLAYGSRTLNGAIIQIQRELEEAGSVCGSSRWRVLRRIVLPLISRAVFNAWLWIALLSYREVTMALVLTSASNVVLATLIWQLWTNGLQPEVGALGVLFMLAAVALSWLAFGLFSRLLGGPSGSTT